MAKLPTLEKLKEELLTVPFIDLEPHVARGSVVVVEEGLDLLAVAMAVAKDDKALIGALILKKQLTRATNIDYEAWKREKKFFNLLIIQPFVLVQSCVALSPIHN
jgi:hypothetical protein